LISPNPGPSAFVPAVRKDPDMVMVATDAWSRKRDPVPVGGGDLIFDAIANLVDNAIKYGRAGGASRGRERKHRWQAGHLDRR
jgi:signal transduction histidine kinase